MNAHDEDHATLDPERVAWILDFGGDLPSKLLEIFLRDAPIKIQLINDAIAASDPDALEKAAHSLQGSCANLGLQRMRAVCKALERVAGTGDLSTAGGLAGQIGTEFHRARPVLISAFGKDSLNGGGARQT